MVKYGQELANMKNKLGTWKEVAYAIGIHPTTLWRWRTKKSIPKKEMQKRIKENEQGSEIELQSKRAKGSLAKLEKKLSTKKTVKSVEKQIDSNNLVKLNIDGRTLSNPRAAYDKMLQGKVKDKQLMQDIIRNRDLLLRKRITAECTCKDTGEKGIIKLTGVLIEELQVFVNMWLGAEFRDSESFRRYHDNNWRTKAIEMGIYKSEVTETPFFNGKNPFKIRTINFTTTFA